MLNIRISLTDAWRRFIPSVPPDAKALGIIQDGFQVGALLLLGDGSYAQVNGDVVRLLNRSRIERALRKANSQPRPPASSPSQPTVVPTITVRRRRRTVQSP
jgi:hypothetical protein